MWGIDVINVGTADIVVCFVLLVSPHNQFHGSNLDLANSLAICHDEYNHFIILDHIYSIYENRYKYKYYLLS